MSVEITGLDIAIRRINTIERNFNTLANTGVQTKPDVDFQNILDAKMTSSVDGGEKVSHGEIDGLIQKYASKNGLDPDFVKAVVKQESGFNPKATSKCGAMGLMQLMPSTAQGLGVQNAYDAEQNIEGGVKYLKGMLDRFGNSKELALAAYNAGPNAVKKYDGIPPYKETQNYVKNIMASYGDMKK